MTLVYKYVNLCNITYLPTHIIFFLRIPCNFLNVYIIINNLNSTIHINTKDLWQLPGFYSLDFF